MEAYNRGQVVHLTELEGQKQRVLLLLDKIILKYSKNIIEKININSNSIQYTNESIEEIVDEMFENQKSFLQEELLLLALYESNFQSKLTNKEKKENIKPLTETQASKILGFSVLGATLATFLRNQKIKLKQELKKEINFIYGQKTTNAAARNRIINNVLNSNKNQLETISRTTTSHILNNTRIETYIKNDIEKVIYSTIADKKRSKICKDLNGLIQFANDPKIINPPQHPNCRSFQMPYFGKGDKYDETFAAYASEEGLKMDENGNFALNKKDIISLKDLEKRDKKKYGF